MKTALRQALEGGFLSILASRLINIKPIFALRAAKEIVWAFRLKDFVAVLAKPKRVFLIGKHRAEHHLNHKQEGVKIPDNRRLIAQLNVIRRRVAVERGHRLSEKLLCVLVVAPLVIEQARRENENPIGKLLLQPVAALGISPLKRHIHSGRLAAHRHSERYHRAVVFNIPDGFNSALCDVGFFCREK